jgi:virulence factor Mce-like protein
MSPLRAGIVTIVVMVIAVYFGFSKKLPFQSHFTLRAAFSSSTDIRKGSPVRIAGVNVGKVTGTQLLARADGQPPGAIVSMQIAGEGLPLHRDATAKIRPRIFLEGNFFVDLTVGSPSAPDLGSGDTIPVTQTADPVQLDQVLSALPTATRGDLQHLLSDLSIGLGGPAAAALNTTIRYMEPAYRYTSVVNQALLGQDEHDLSNYIASAGLVAQAADADPPALESLITDFNTTTGALAAEDGALAQAVRDLPQTLATGQPALAALDASFPPLRALATTLDPGVRSSVPAVNAAIPLARQLRLLVRPAELRGLVSDLRPTVPSLAQLNVRTVPLLDQVRAASGCQNSVILPWTQMTLNDPAFPATGPVYQEAVKWLPSNGAESRSGDANGQWFRTLVVAPNVVAPIPGGNSFQLSANPIQGANPPKPSTLPMLRADLPCETQQLPNLDTQSSGPPAGQHAIVAPSGAAFQRRYDSGLGGAVRLARSLVDQAGLGQLLRVVSTPLSSRLIPQLRELSKW